MDRHRPQDDLPYEYRMKYIIEDYIKMRNALDMIESYTKKLEETVKMQQSDIRLLQQEIDNIKELCHIGHIHELPNYLRRLKDESKCAKLEIKYKEAKEMITDLKKKINKYDSLLVKYIDEHS